MIACRSFCVVAKLCLTLYDPHGLQPLSMGFPRQEYWSGFPFPSPGDLPNPGIEPGSHTLAGRFFTTEPPGKPNPIEKEYKMMKRTDPKEHCI